MAITLKTPIIVTTDEDLLRVTRENPGYRIERESDGSIIVSPTHTKGGPKSLEAAAQLRDYAKRAGGKAFDSSTGFAIGPGQRVRSPDGGWLGQARIDALIDAGADTGYWAVSPDVVIEVKSDSDTFAETLAKVATFHERGTGYGVAIDPTTRAVKELGAPPAGLLLDFDAIIDA
jgi:Uma2 family endonuclease